VRIALSDQHHRITGCSWFISSAAISRRSSVARRNACPAGSFRGGCLVLLSVKHRRLVPHIYINSRLRLDHEDSKRSRPSLPRSSESAGHMMMRHSMFCFSASTVKPSLPANVNNDLHTSRAPMRIEHLHDVPALGHHQPAKEYHDLFLPVSPCRFWIEIRDSWISGSKVQESIYITPHIRCYSTPGCKNA
jgi:hypothetical protein